MALSDDTKNELKGMVATIRERLTNEFTEQLQELYGIQPEGEIADVEDLSLVDEEQRTVAEQLRESIEHYAGGPDASKKERKEAIQRTIREQAFTVLNRFAALRLAEERDLVSESVGGGFDSAGFRVYERLAGSSLGETTYDRYRVYLECLFDELALDLGVLFDRYAPEGLLFPREEALEDVLDALNQEDVEDAWTEDETIGWIYQYFHPKSERKGMRDESSTPRNSREMAVRNQLFTPRYVVEFLVDNSLGRYWHEMTDGETDLTDDLDYFVPRENELFLGEDEDPPEDPDDDLYVAPYRELKDPREIRLLDPACGSMHFGLYAFDLFEQIYAEAWDRYPNLRASLQEDLELEEGDREAFLREVPRLIVEHNLYGIDIDRRAAQIAGLALWLRAQRAWSESDVDSADRPRIRESGIVCAEPMPGEKDLLEAYVEKLEVKGPEGRLLGDLVREIWDRMQIAGEAGPLLKIEREIEDVLEEARRQFEKRQKRKERDLGTQGVMFDDLEQPEQAELQFDVSGVEESFFEQAESLLMDALQEFAAESTEGTDYGRRLFVDDAERGFDFLELMHAGTTTGFDVVVMNPPFGESSKSSKDYIERHYPASRSDIYQSFVSRAKEVLSSNGYLGAITSRTGFFLNNSENFRKKVCTERFEIKEFVDLGYEVLDATVETCCFTLRSFSKQESMNRIRKYVKSDSGIIENEKFSIPQYMRENGYNENSKIERGIAEREIKEMESIGLLEDVSGHYPQFETNKELLREIESKGIELENKSIFFRLIDVDNKGKELKLNITKRDQYDVKIETIKSIPGQPFAYWVTDEVRNLFRELSAFGERNDARAGLCTGDDFRFVRLWWEVNPVDICPPEPHEHEWNGPYCVNSEARWFHYIKGNAFTEFEPNTNLLVNWKKDGREIKEGADTGDVPGARVQNTDFYFRPGLTYGSRERLFSPKPVPKGCIFSHTGFMLYVEMSERVFIIAQYLNSDITRSILGILAPPRKNEIGYVKNIPVPKKTNNSGKELEQIYEKAVKASRKISSTKEDRLNFLDIEDIDVKEGYKRGRVNEIVSDKILELSTKSSNNLLSSLSDVAGLSGKHEDVNHLKTAVETISHDKSKKETSRRKISYFVGVCFGRYDVRLISNKKEGRDYSDPGDPLPVCSPGMLTCENGLPTKNVPSDYPIDIPRDGILVEDEVSTHSLSQGIRDTLEAVYGPREMATVEREITEYLGTSDIEEYIINPNNFFEDHKSLYSQSRRRAPIYWPLQTHSQDYTLWVYYPDLDTQTLYTCINDYITPKLENEVRPELKRLREKVQSGEPEARDELGRLETLEQELEEMHEELLRVAELPYEPNQNDGVELTAAPLHNLFQHTSWSDRLEDYWEELQAGEYDWAHIAYSIWPDRVEDVCREDKSTAIAHDREDLYEGDS